MLPPPKKCEIVIIGGGIIGCSTAYFISRHPAFDSANTTVHVLEASKIAGGASGKAGGLLALWAYPSNIVPLSYSLHAELAKEHDGEHRWGYRRIHSAQLDAKGRALSHQGQRGGISSDGDSKNNLTSVSLQKRDPAALGRLRAAGFPLDLDWVAPDCARAYEEMGDPSTTAQVHPYQFTTSMAKLAAERGVNIIEGAQVEKINERADTDSSAVEGVTYVQDGERKTLSATHVVLSAGPWTGRLHSAIPIGGLRAHSVTIKPTRDISPYALFTSIDLPPNFDKANRKGHVRSQTVSPEIYARPGKEVYACGEGDKLIPLPEVSADVEVDMARCQDIINHVASISDELRDGEVTARQACYLPVVSGGSGSGPFIGQMRQCRGLIVAAGHSCWGIQNGPGTGKLVSEIIMDGKAKSAKLGQLDAARNL